MNDLAQDTIDPDGAGNNTSDSFESILEVQLCRRTLLKGGLAASLGFGLSGCGGSYVSGAALTPSTKGLPTLSFKAVAKSLADTVSVPEGYTYTILFATGDPIDTSTSEYKNNGTDDAASFVTRSGDNHDAIHYFGLNSAGTARDDGNSARGLLVMNHEYINQMFLHTEAEVAAYNVAARPAAQIDKEVAAHGVSVIEVQKSGASYKLNKGSPFNRRITAATPMEITGPARGHDLMVTKYSPDGTQTRGTLNNCAHGYTPWGTYLTCEENWAGYFKRSNNEGRSAKERAALDRYGVGKANNGEGRYGWANSTSMGDLYDRWNVTVTGATAKNDYRNAANTMGWVVEIDPFDPYSIPRKRTALGRFAHEGALSAKFVAGKPLVFYSGDDARNEYIYKFVSSAKWDANDANKGLAAGNKYLDSGTLYAAKFNNDGSGQWLKLDISEPAIRNYAAYPFADQADVLLHCRIAADAMGATKMDRPEWGAVHPVTGEVYMTLTNNSNRGKTGVPLNAANPRFYRSEGKEGNRNGHIIRWREAGGDPAATTFTWDIYLFGAQAKADDPSSDAYYQANVNLSGLSEDNDFSSPDGLWFSERTPGLLWFQTDDGAYTDTTNCMMLAAIPGHVGDGSVRNVLNQDVPTNGSAHQTISTRVGAPPGTARLRRFLVGPRGCEVTGVIETPDGKALFVNIQHPGEGTSSKDISDPAKYLSHWPAGGNARPLSATIVITRQDGGVVGV